LLEEDLMPYQWPYQGDLRPFDSLQEVARETVPYLETGNIALSGGSTYGDLFPLWAELKPDCTGSRFFPADERMVPLKDPASNWRKAYESFLVPVKRAQDVGHFPVSADGYNGVINSYFLGFFPVFDVIFLGMGEDGHTASLFPGGTYWDEENTAAIETESPVPPTRRISLSPEVIVKAHHVVVIIAGEYKLWAVKQVFEKNQEIPLVKILEKRKNSLVYLHSGLLKEMK